MVEVETTLENLLNNEIPDADGEEFKCTFTIGDTGMGTFIDISPNDGDYKQRILLMAQGLKALLDEEGTE